MSGIVHLLSAVIGAPTGTAAGRGAASDAFAQLFPVDASAGASVDLTARAEAGADPRARLSLLLAGLGRKAAQLEDQAAGAGDDDAAGDGTADMSAMVAELAAALAAFDRDSGAGLVPTLAAALPQDVMGAAAGAEAVVTPALFRAVLADVGKALNGLAEPAPAQGFAVSRTLSALSLRAGEAVATDGELSRAATAPAVVSRVEASVPVQAPVGVQPTGAKVAPQQAAPADTAAAIVAQTAEPEEAANPISATEPAVLPEEAADILLLPLVTARGDRAMPGTADLLARIVAAASAIGAAPQPQGGGMPGGTRDRRGAAEEAMAALPREGEAWRPHVATADKPAQARAPDQPRFAEVLANQVRAAEVSEGHTRIELSPRGLGGIEVDVTDTQDGSLRVVVRAENPAVLTALRADRDLLAQALGGLDAGALDLQSFSQQDSGRDNGGSGQSAALGAAAMTEADAAATATRQTQPDLIGRGRLDIVT